MIVIVTDSSASITRQDAHLLGAIAVPMSYTLCGETYQESYADANGEFVPLLRKDPSPHTSQPTIDRYFRTFQALRRAGFEVLCLTMSSRLSGSYNNAAVSAAALQDEGIRVVDSRTTAIGLAFLVREARMKIAAGASLQEAADAVIAMRDRVCTLFSVSDMQPLRRSGRLGPVRQSVGTILNLRPLLTCKEGAVISGGVAHGPGDQLRQLAAAVPSAAKEIGVQHIASPREAKILSEMLKARCQTEVTVRTLGPVLGIHLGVTVLGVMWFSPDEPNAQNRSFRA